MMPDVIPMDWILAAFAGCVFGMLSAAFCMWAFLLKSRVSRAAYDALESAKNMADADVAALKNEMKAERAKFELKQEAAHVELQGVLQKTARLEAEKQGFAAQIEQHKIDLERMEEKFRMQFENLANRIFEEKSVKFKKDLEEGLGQMLNPLKEKIQEFQKKVDESFGEQAKEQFSLKNEIQRIVLANEKITVQAENLTNALKGDTKTQGHWGEVALEKILEDSGLRKGLDYKPQVAIKDDHGNHQRPDFVVFQPGDKHIIVDSKVSLTHYEAYFNAGDEAVRAESLKHFLASVKKHVQDLEQRKYQDNEALGAPDFVLMFMPTEGSYSLAIQKDHSLHGFAWEKRIAIVGPSTLFVALKTIASLWRIERQNRNAQEIAQQGGALYDKIVGFVEDMRSLGVKIGATQNAYDEAYKKLCTGRGNVLRQTENLKQLGARASKNMPKDMLEDDDLLELAQNPEEKRGAA